MHVVGLRGFGVRIVTRGNSDSSSSSNPAMAVLKILSILPTPSCAKSFHGMNPKPKLCSARAWSSQAIRADAGAAAVSDAESKRAAQSGAFVDGLLGSQAASAPTTSQILFLGTGTSEGIPRVSCLTNPAKSCPVSLQIHELGQYQELGNEILAEIPDGLVNHQKFVMGFADGAQVCLAAAQLGNKNRRRNTSLMVRYLAPDGRLLNILIDAGKFFYHSAMQWFPYYGIRNLDAVIITHAHADANGGLDDLRDWTNNVQPHIPIYVGLRDLTVMAKSHYYLVDTSVIMKGTAVTKLQFIPMSEDPFQVHGLKVTPLPVWHGPGYRSLGFRIGGICYISDASEIPAETYPLLENCDLLILDALRPDRSSATHFGMPAALDEVRKIRPKRTLFTGMMHTMNHDKINAELAKLLDSEGLDVQLSFDGMLLPVTL